MENALQAKRVEEGSLIEDETDGFDGSRWIFKYRADLEPLERQSFRVTRVPGVPFVTIHFPLPLSVGDPALVYATIIGWNQGSPFLCLQNNSHFKTKVVATVHVVSSPPVK